jgi:4-hydroxy-4-methyl-2-oxoglutarate aldolase
MKEYTEKIIEYLRKNRVSTTEVADCLNKSGVLKDAKSICNGHYCAGIVKWVYGYNSSNWSVHEQVIDTEKDSIVFIETFDCEDRAIIGELVSKYILVYRQASAIISNAPFRDANDLLKERYPIWCNGFTPVGCFNKKCEQDLDAKIKKSHYEKYHDSIAVCDDSGVVIIPKEQINEKFYQKLCDIELQEDIWFDCLDRRKWNTYDIVCQKRYLKED